MDPSGILIPIILVILILLSAFFSASETALVALSPSKVQALIVQKAKFAKWIEYLKDRPQKMFLIILIFINMVNAGASVIATVYFTNMFGPIGAGYATLVMGMSLMIFSEVLPKSFANKHPVMFSQFVAYPLVILGKVIFPFVWILEKFLTKVVGQQINSVSEDEVIAMVSMGAQDGSLEKHEKELIENVLEFNDISADDVMTPRTSIFALPSTTNIKDAIEKAAEIAHSRIPVYQDTIDNIIGFVTVKKLLAISMDSSYFDKTLADLELYEFIKIPTSRKIYSLFLEFKRKRTHIALVYDEHGGIEGIVTMEDILEEIVGEIIDETDGDEKETITRKDEKTLILEGDAEIGDIERMLNAEIPDYENVDQISWVILEHLSRFPKKGEEIIIGGAKFKVIEMDDNSNRILKVQAEKLDNNSRTESED
jgi:CBS domain containing-hemolysin-like protein